MGRCSSAACSPRALLLGWPPAPPWRPRCPAPRWPPRANPHPLPQFQCFFVNLLNASRVTARPWEGEAHQPTGPCLPHSTPLPAAAAAASGSALALPSVRGHLERAAPPRARPHPRSRDHLSWPLCFSPGTHSPLRPFKGSLVPIS